MSNIRLQGNPSGTGTLTIASPNTNSDFTLNLPASGGTVLLDGATQSPTFNAVTATSVATTSATTTTLAVNGNNISAVNSLGFRNRIINGGMVIDQRNNGASLTINSTTPQYPVDRMVCGGWASAGVFTVQQSTTATAGFVNSLVCTVTTTSALSTSGEEYVVRQNIEGLNVADLRWGTANASAVTLSFWVRSSLTGTFAGSITNNAYDRSYVFTYTISSANTYEYKTVTIPGDTVGTWLTNNGNGLRLQFNLGAGSSKTASPGSWGAGYLQNATGSVQLINTNGATWFITGVQLEAGSVATPFERRDYGRELMMCQRYYWRITSTASLPLLPFGAAASSTELHIVGNYPVQMRATPAYSGSTGQIQISTASGGTAVVTSVSFVGTNIAYRTINTISTTSMTANTPYFLRALEPGGFVDFSAEL